MKKQSWYRTLCILLIIILVASIGAMLVQTNFGKVRTMNISIVTDHQQQLNATSLYNLRFTLEYSRFHRIS